MARWTKAFPSYSTLYSFVEVTDWAIKSDRVTFNLAGGITSSYYWNVGGIGCTLGWWESGTYHTIDTDTVSYNRSGGDLTVFSRSEYFARQDDDRTVYLYHEGSASGTAYAESSAYTVPHKAPVPSGLTATRASDTQVNLSWTNPSRSYEAMCIEVSTDGGSWSEVVALFNTSSSWTWNGAAPDHSYRFRIRTYYKAAYSAYHTWSGTITMAPASPSSMSTSAAGGTSVTVTLANSSPVATGIEWQTTTGDPSDESAWSASTAVSGSPVTQFTASLGGVGYIRVRNTNSVGASAWLVSEQVVTICPPNPPTLRSPASGAYDSSQGDIVFSWLHNPLDGSAQTAYELRYAVNGGAWITLSGTTASSRTVALSGFSVGDSVTWQVRTKGADASYSDWSASQTFTVYTAPSVSIASPTGTITGTPVTVSSTYSDMAGFSCVSSSLALKRDGRTLYTEDMGGSMSATITQGEFLPENGASYTLEVTVRSSSGLTASSSSTFDVQWTPPVAGELNITNDHDTGYASLLATFDNSASEITYTGSTNTQYESTEGYVRSLTVEGKSEKWNQLLANGNFASSDGWTASSATMSVSSGVCSISANTGTWGGAVHNCYPSVSGHKYLVMLRAKSDTSNSINVATGYGDNLTIGSVGSSWTDIAGILTASRVNTSINIANSNSTDAFSFTNVTLFDLTAIFGAGNEPTTVDAFKATDVYKAKLAAGELYDYDAGSLVSIEVVSVGDGTITTTLRSAGSVHDELQADADSWTVERRVGVVDLGSLTWGYDSTPKRFSGPRLDGIKIYAGWNSIGLLISNGYKAEYVANSDDGKTDIYGVYKGYIYAKDTDYTDAASFKAAMSGVMLYYELATPTQGPETSMDTIDIGSAFTVSTDLDSTFEMTTWDGSADAVSVSVSRVNADGSITPLITEGDDNTGVVDMYAPLNTDYQYAVATKASSGAVNTVYVDNRLESMFWFAYWTDPDGVQRTAKAKWNPSNGGVQMTRPSKTRVFYAGRRDPVSYDGAAVSLAETPAWMFIGKDETDAFVQLVNDGGRGVYKSCDGWVYHADFDLTLSPSYTAIGYYGGASLNVTRIAGERL